MSVSDEFYDPFSTDTGYGQLALPVAESISESGEYEADFNILNRAPSFRVVMDPETGVFNFQVCKAKIPAYPVFQALGVGDDEMAANWGPEFWKLNREKGSRNPAQAVQKVYDRLGAVRARPASGDFVDESLAGILWLGEDSTFVPT